MVEITKDVVQASESKVYAKENLMKLPADMLSTVSFYLTHYEISKLSMCSLYFNQASHLHYKMLCLKELEDIEESKSKAKVTPQPQITLSKSQTLNISTDQTLKR